ncbi:transmembrane protease serine 9-like [Eupeodes corollae]|uniref:transmembrane protease serine 9-like n=1 Tax=Eupeodes corollae TaxID=290404 RepID=UPI002490F6A7|nr:transmembrane protease serine 9-like [Eupeodes corollae]
MDKKCGVTTTRRIVGGKVAAVNELPWLTLITYNNTIQCGGTLINDRYVLTAAHCIRGFDRQLFELKFLEYNTASSMDTVSVRRKISRVHSLKTYIPKTSDDDIAILKLSKPIDFDTTTVRPICLPPQGLDLTGETGTISGWGTAAATEEENSTIALQTTEVPILSNDQCLLVGMKLTDNMVCAGRLLDGEINACQGESGGPLMVMDKKRHLLAGVISWGDGCAKPLKPGIYARVTRYLPWINKHTKGSFYES